MGAGVAARISEIFFYTQKLESEMFYKESISNKKKFWRLGGNVGGNGVGVWLG